MDKGELIRMLKYSDNPGSRWEAASELSSVECCDEDVIEAFAYALKEEDMGVKDICSRALIELPYEYKDLASRYVSPYILDNNIELRNLSGDILIKLGQSSIGYMINYLDNPDYVIRQFACDVIGKISNPSALDSIYRLLHDENPNVVNSAIEAIGNIGDVSSFDVLVSLYGTNDDLKPGIIEAIGKIGSNESENFLLECLKTEDDTFLKTAAIDSLAFCANNIEICDDLMNELYYTPPELQPILLKTIYAIASRNEAEIELPGDLRHVAHNALFDDEKDIVGAGLVALGYYYIPGDIPSLINIMMKDYQDMQMHILTVLMAYSDLPAIRIFFENYFEKTEFDENLPEFLSNIEIVWKNIPSGKSDEIIKLLMDICFDSSKSNKQVLTEVLCRLNREVVANKLSYLLGVGSDYSEDILDLAGILRLSELRDEIANISGSKTVLSEKAAEILDYLN
jgi:hypothetical protein